MPEPLTPPPPTIDQLPGVGPTRVGQLARLGIHSPGDLLEYFPFRYQLESGERPIRQLSHDQIQTARGTVTAVDYIASTRPRFEATLDDGTAPLSLTWFNGAYLRRRIHPGQTLRVRGKVTSFRGIARMTNPKWQVVDENTPTIEGSVFRPIYPGTAELGSEQIARIVDAALPTLLKGVEEWFEERLLKKRDLIGRRQAFEHIHRPPDPRAAAAARRRLVYDELMLLQLGPALSRRMRDGRLTAPILRVDKLLDQRIRARFPFQLTDAQQRAIWEVLHDLQSGRPMHRLLQGDVGCGKTSVALYAMLVAVANKMQAAILAPTEVLAEQHFLTISRAMEGSSVRVRLYTARTRRQSRGRILGELVDGQVHIAVGTQSLLAGDVEFANLGLVIVDEQHKLGVRQRATFRSKGLSPHYLIMTATPIPRTLAMSYFADFDLSTIDQLPPGRTPIRTRHLRPSEASLAYAFLREQVAAGRQGYVVLPQVEGDRLDDAKGVKSELERLRGGALAGVRIEMLHGQMPQDQRQQVMRDFRNGEIDVLVCTTVIEVGVDVPNATVMLIDSADRFGLSQLHQLRGRVGRGSHASHCLLIADPTTDDARARMDVMCRTNDGFQIAEADLNLRGPGDFLGTRQHGLPGLKLADISSEMHLLHQARDDALDILARDPSLETPQHTAVKRALLEKFGDTLALGQIG